MKKILIILIGLALIFSTVVLAAPASDCTEYCGDPKSYDPPTGQVCICNPLQGENIESIVNNVIDFIFNIAIFLAPLMIIYAGVLFVTAGGNPEQVKKAKAVIIWTLIGFVLVLVSKGVSDLIETLIGI